MPSLSAVFLLSALAIHAAVLASATSTASETPKKQAWKPRHRGAAGRMPPVEPEEEAGYNTKENRLPAEQRQDSKELARPALLSITRLAKPLDSVVLQVAPEASVCFSSPELSPEDVLPTGGDEENAYKLSDEWHQLIYNDNDPERLLDELTSMFTRGYEERFRKSTPQIAKSVRDEGKNQSRD